MEPVLWIPFHSALFLSQNISSYLRRIKVFKPLNYIPYNKSKAIQLLQSKYGWKPYSQSIMNLVSLDSLKDIGLISVLILI